MSNTLNYVINEIQEVSDTIEGLANDIDADAQPNLEKYRECLEQKKEMLDEAIALIENSDFAMGIADFEEAINLIYSAQDVVVEY
jgi:hypothetical protein